MSDSFQIPRGLPIKPPSSVQAPKQKKAQNNRQGGNFQELFSKELEKSTLKFSAHAEKRLRDNKIELSTEEMKALEDAVSKINQKGGKESLVVLNDVAFLVSVPNNTVITAIDSSRMKENVFTNIDSAVIT